MAGSSSLEGRQWTDLAYLDESEREPAMEARYKELIDLPEEHRTKQLASMEAAVYDLPSDTLRSFTVSRLRVWLKMDHDIAQKISRSFDTITDEMDGDRAMKHIAVVQTMAREFSLEDQARLFRLFPRIYGALAPLVDILESVPATTIATQKPWWAFWRT